MLSKSRTTLRVLNLENRTVPAALVANSISDVSSDFAIAEVAPETAVAAFAAPVGAMDASRGVITVTPLPKKPLLNPRLYPPSRSEIGADSIQPTTAIPLSSPNT